MRTAIFGVGALGTVLGCTVAWGATLKEPGVSELTSSPDSLTFSIVHAIEDGRLKPEFGTLELFYS